MLRNSYSVGIYCKNSKRRVLSILPLVMSSLCQRVSSCGAAAIGTQAHSPTVSTYIAIGSNLGDKVEAFKEALHRLKELGTIKCTSYLYRTPPMYVTDQDEFLNAACHLHTTLSPEELLEKLKSIEVAVGRKQSFRNGPRLIDLDIILYGDKCVDTPTLQIPHVRLHERAFVLRPLCDIDGGIVHPRMNKTVEQLLAALPKSELDAMKRVVPMCRGRGGKVSELVDIEKGPIVCGILNITPDSFSDGGQFQDVSSAIRHAQSMLAEGAGMLDVGGESTRPGSAPVTPEEEVARVVPVIKALRAAGIECPISIDTRNAIVAKEAILCGADVVNDVSGGRHDPEMLKTVAELNVPIVLMHMRGTPQTMTSAAHTKYGEDIISDIAKELNEQLAKADELLPRWLQIVDPGVGFAKGERENVELLKSENMKRLRRLLGDRPLYIGTSRKRFLGAIIDRADALNASNKKDHPETSVVRPSGADIKSPERLQDLDTATAATSCLAVLGGARIIRVHNVRATKVACDILKAVQPMDN